MTYDDIIALLVGRIERGVTQRTQIGRDSQWQRVTLCLELHRLMEHYKGFGRYELLNLTMQTVYGCERDKHQCKADLKVYAQMEQAFGDGEWPLPDIRPDVHRKIRNALRCEIEKRKTAADRERRTAEKRSQQRADRRQRVEQAMQDYPNMPTKDVAKKYGLSKDCIQSNAHQRGIRKDREAVRRHREDSKQQTRLRQLQRRKAILTKKLEEVEEEISNIKE